MENKKVAIIFFGLTRSLKKTINSIKENLFTPLDKGLINYDIFIHTYKINGAYHNIWSREHTDNYINEDVEGLLNPKFYIFDNQDDVINSINFDDYYSKLGNWGGFSGLSQNTIKYLIRNMCLALYSKKKIVLLFENYKDEYNYAIIIRPELLLKNKIDINYFNELNDNNIIIPQKDSYIGCNDRFCIGKIDTILYYGKLFDDLMSYSKEKSIISELYLLDKLNEKKINIIKKNIDYDTKRM
jgi:hypothetical protein